MNSLKKLIIFIMALSTMQSLSIRLPPIVTLPHRPWALCRRFPWIPACNRRYLSGAPSPAKNSRSLIKIHWDRYCKYFPNSKFCKRRNLSQEPSTSKNFRSLSRSEKFATEKLLSHSMKKHK